jgi:hypothetical protein
MHLISVARVRRSAGTATLLLAGALALTGCGGDDSGTPKAAHSVVATTGATAQTSAEPADTDAASPTPGPAATLRDYTGSRIGTAIAAAEADGITYAVQLQGTGRRASAWSPDEKVCDQDTGADGVTFTLARDGHDCAGRLLHTPAPTHAGPSGGSGGGGGAVSSGSGGTSSSGGSGSGGSSGGGGKACAITSSAGNCYAYGQFCAQHHHGLSTYGKGGEYLTCRQDGSGRWRWSDGVAG